MLQPGLDAYSGQALGHELQLAVFTAGVVHLHQRAVLGQRVGVEVAVVFRWRVHEEQRKGVVRGLGDEVQGFRPGFFVDDDGQHLRREERAVVNRDDVHFVRQLFAGQGQGVAGHGLGVEVLDGGRFVRRVRLILLIAHGAPA